MSGSNGADEHRAMVDRALRQIATPVTFADLSSAERSRMVDALIAAHNRMAQVVEAQGRQVTVLTAMSKDSESRIAECEAYMASAMSRQPITFLARLRWLVLGR